MKYLLLTVALLLLSNTGLTLKLKNKRSPGQVKPATTEKPAGSEKPSKAGSEKPSKAGSEKPSKAGSEKEFHQEDPFAELRNAIQHLGKDLDSIEREVGHIIDEVMIHKMPIEDAIEIINHYRPQEHHNEQETAAVFLQEDGANKPEKASIENEEEKDFNKFLDFVISELKHYVKKVHENKDIIAEIRAKEEAEYAKQEIEGDDKVVDTALIQEKPAAEGTQKPEEHEEKYIEGLYPELDAHIAKEHLSVLKWNEVAEFTEFVIVASHIARSIDEHKEQK